MALVAAQDWPNNDMDSRQQRTHSSSPHHDNHQQPASVSSPYPSQPQQAQHQAQNPYVPYGQPPWPAMNVNMANIAAMNHINGHAHQPSPSYFPPMPFYPQNYPHMQQQPPVGPQQQPAFGNPPYFDPNAQFAQWAYQRMMFNAQAQQLPGPPIPQQQQQSQSQIPQTSQPQNRGRSSSNSHSTYSPVSTPTEYIPSGQLPFSHSNGSVVSAANSSSAGNSGRFPQAPAQSSQSIPPSNNYQGFHPYRRPDRAERQRTYDTSPSPPQSSMNSVPFTPPYARQDAAGSTTSVNSTSNSSQRSRTNSTNSASGGSIRGQDRSATSSSTTGSVRGVSSPYPNAHPSRISSSSSSQSAPSVARSSSAPGAGGTGGVTVSVSSSTNSMNSRTARPSPLSQGSTYSSSSGAAERRKSRDDSDLAAMLSSQSLGSLGMEGTASGSGHGPRNGLKGRLRRALSFNAIQTLKEEDDEDATVAIGSSKKKVTSAAISGAETDEGDDGDTSMATMKKKKSLRIFNSRFNASTDNISLSSTVSSASVMIRKLGSMGRLARRNSLAGITSLFKDKNKEGEAGGSKSGKKNKGKAGKAEVSVSHVTAETDRSSNEWSAPGMEGLSPAATLARQHTLRSNAEAAARAKAQQEAQAAAAAEASAAASSSSASSQVAAWDRNTTTRHGQPGPNGAVREDGMRLVVEEDSDEDVLVRRPSSDRTPHHEEGSGSDEESTWRGHGDDDEDEDVTIRVGMDRSASDDVRSGTGHEEEEEVEVEPWAVDVRRSIERARVPAKGILKNSESYSQEAFGEGPNPAFAQNRVRANSYDSVPSQNGQAGPFARMPSPNPDHIDGLHKHHGINGPSHVTISAPPLLPPLSFESPDSDTSLNPASTSPPVPEKQAFFNHPNLNSSEPALSTMMASPPTLTHRSATTPSKRLAFATNLSIYDTFSPAVYDRRSEPATWSRLTPALAQRIKEELNSFKMEEMEVHHASRVHTQFFV